MFWGRGDSSRLADEERQTLAHLRRLVETKHIVSLNAEQVDVALRAIDFYSQWESVLRLMNSAKNIALLVGALLAIYWASKGALIDFIRDAAP